MSESRSPEPGYGRKGRQPVSRRKQRGHKAQPRSRKAGRTGESEYRTQFKAWPIAPRTSENLRGTRRKTGRAYVPIVHIMFMCIYVDFYHYYSGTSE